MRFPDVNIDIDVHVDLHININLDVDVDFHALVERLNLTCAMSLVKKSWPPQRWKALFLTFPISLVKKSSAT